MFTRIVELTAKTGKQRQLTRVVDDKVVPILKNQTGFVDEIVLISDTDRDQVLALSFWESQDDAARYTHEQYPRINELISHLVSSAPVSRTFNVDAFRVTTSELAKLHRFLNHQGYRVTGNPEVVRLCC